MGNQKEIYNKTDMKMRFKSDRQRKAVMAKLKPYRVLRWGVRIQGVPYATPSIIRLKPAIAKPFLDKKEIEEYKPSRSKK